MTSLISAESPSSPSFSLDLQSLAEGEIYHHINIGLVWDCVEDVCFPLFHCFFEMCMIPKSLLNIVFFLGLGIG